MKRLLTILLPALLITPGLLRADAGKIAPVQRPKIQIAILLDTSGSMSGLIDQAKAHLWNVVNEFATARRGGVRPVLQVSVYEYGKSSLRGDEGYIRQIVPLTDDLDKVSKELFALRTNGGEEYCGWVIKDAVGGLQWSKDNRDLKAIFIAGNEPFTQGKVSYIDACKGAIQNGIVVNTIHCGNYEVGVQGKWKHGALLADGSYVSIDHNKAVARINAPQDKKIAELNAQLNTTYIGYGRRGKKRAAMQMEQDANARKMAPSAAVARAQTKAGGFYSNESWDLVDAEKKGKVDLKKIKAEELPENMRKMTPAEREKYVKEQAAKREKIQQQILELSEARKTYIAAEMKKRAKDRKEKSLDEAMVESLKKQAVKKNFTFK